MRIHRARKRLPFTQPPGRLLRARIGGVAACALVLLASTVAWPEELTLTFIGNEAFHITDGDTTLLSDFPYRSGAFGYMEYDLAEVPPIENGLSLITHVHADHWHKGHFEAMDHHILAPPAMTKRLDPARVVVPAEDGHATFRDMAIEIIETPHALAQEHFSYLVTWHGLRIYFPGDTETPADLLAQKDIDVMFITPWLIRTIRRQDLTVDAERVIVYHHHADEELPEYPGLIALDQGETLTIPLVEREEAK